MINTLYTRYRVQIWNKEALQCSSQLLSQAVFQTLSKDVQLHIIKDTDLPHFTKLSEI